MSSEARSCSISMITGESVKMDVETTGAAMGYMVDTNVFNHMLDAGLDMNGTTKWCPAHCYASPMGDNRNAFSKMVEVHTGRHGPRHYLEIFRFIATFSASNRATSAFRTSFLFRKSDSTDS